MEGGGCRTFLVLYYHLFTHVCSGDDTIAVNQISDVLFRRYAYKIGFYGIWNFCWGEIYGISVEFLCMHFGLRRGLGRNRI